MVNWAIQFCSILQSGFPPPLWHGSIERKLMDDHCGTAILHTAALVVPLDERNRERKRTCRNPFVDILFSGCFASRTAIYDKSG